MARPPKKTKPRPGQRPLSGKHGKRAPVVQIKLTPSTRDTWQAAADRQGQTLSEWLREAGDLAVARGSTR